MSEGHGFRYGHVVRGFLEGGLAGSLALLAGSAAVSVLQVDGGIGATTAPALAVLYLVEGLVFGAVMTSLLRVRSVGVATAVAGLLMTTNIAALIFAAALGYLLFFPVLAALLLVNAVAIVKVLLTPAEPGERIPLGASLLLGIGACLAMPVVLLVLAPILPPMLESSVGEFGAESPVSVIPTTFFMAIFFPFWAPYFLPVLGACYGAGLRSITLRPTSSLERFVSDRFS